MYVNAILLLFTDQTQIKSEISNACEKTYQNITENDFNHVDIFQDNVDQIKEVRKNTIVEFISIKCLKDLYYILIRIFG